MPPEAEMPVAWVTGARKGLGRALAEHLAATGFRVVGCSRAAADWQAEQVEHAICDVADEKAVQRLAQHIRRRYGRLDALVNNAGIAAMNHALLTPASTLDDLLRTNVTGTFVVSREAAKVMRAGGSGRIVNLSSVAVPLRLEGESAYAASKAAVESLTRTLARELAPLNITVNAVGPGPVETDLIRGVPGEKIDALCAQLPLKRRTTIEDVINAVDFFLRPASGGVTGQVLYLGGAG